MPSSSERRLNRHFICRVLDLHSRFTHWCNQLVWYKTCTSGALCDTTCVNQFSASWWELTSLTRFELNVIELKLITHSVWLHWPCVLWVKLCKFHIYSKYSLFPPLLLLWRIRDDVSVSLTEGIYEMNDEFFNMIAAPRYIRIPVLYSCIRSCKQL